MQRRCNPSFDEESTDRVEDDNRNSSNQCGDDRNDDSRVTENPVSDQVRPKDRLADHYRFSERHAGQRPKMRVTTLDELLKLRTRQPRRHPLLRAWCELRAVTRQRPMDCTGVR